MAWAGFTGPEGRAARLFDGLESFGVTVLLFGLPFSEALKSTGLALGALGLVGKLAFGGRPAFLGRSGSIERKTAVALLAFLAIAALSVVLARPGFRRPGELLTLGMTAAPFFLVADVCGRESRRLFLALAIVAGAALASLLAYAEHMSGDYHRLVLGSIENAVPAAEYLGAVLMMALAFLVVEVGAPLAGPIFAFCTGLTGLALLMTKSRGPLAGVALGIAVTIGAGMRSRRLALLAVAAMIVGVAAFTALFPAARVAEAGRAVEQVGRSRLATWGKTIDHIAERPVLGHGYGSYPALGVTYSDESITIHQLDAHNTWLQAACDTGYTGAGTFVAFLVLGIAGTAKAIRGSSGPARAVSVGSLGALLVLIAAGMTSVTTNAEPGLLFFALLALGAADWSGSRPTSGPRPRPRSETGATPAAAPDNGS